MVRPAVVSDRPHPLGRSPGMASGISSTSTSPPNMGGVEAKAARSEPERIPKQRCESRIVLEVPGGRDQIGSDRFLRSLRKLECRFKPAERTNLMTAHQGPASLAVPSSNTSELFVQRLVFLDNHVHPGLVRGFGARKPSILPPVLPAIPRRREKLVLELVVEAPQSREQQRLSCPGRSPSSLRVGIVPR